MLCSHSESLIVITYIHLLLIPHLAELNEERVGVKIESGSKSRQQALT